MRLAVEHDLLRRSHIIGIELDGDHRVHHRLKLGQPLREEIQRERMRDENLDRRGRGSRDLLHCQTAFKRDLRSASKRDPLFGYDVGLLR